MEDRILLLDDDRDQCEVLEATLGRLAYLVTTTTSPREALDKLAQQHFDVVLTDLRMAEMDGLEVCARILGVQPGVPVIVVTGQGSLETAVAAMRAGAYDFLSKPIDAKLLELAVARAAQHGRLNNELKRLREAVDSTTQGPLVGESPAVRRLTALIARVGPSDVSVLIQGETGTGKELVARAIHDCGLHKDGPFVAINCAAVPASLLESELFGHARGAFTDAKTQRRGLFLEASDGTLFLDEIGEMPLEMQAKLLRALQERKIRPVGANTEVSFSARIIAATHRDLEADVKAGRFRQDLFYRINVVRVDVPSLRDRGTDILTLTDHFLAKAATRRGTKKLGLRPHVAERLLAYDWPGNVRELENGMERAAALSRLDEISVQDLPEKIRAYEPEHFTVSADEISEIVPIDELERRYILRVIRLLGGNKARAAQMLGVDRRTLYRKLEKYDHKGGQTMATDGAVPEPSSALA